MTSVPVVPVTAGSLLYGGDVVAGLGAYLARAETHEALQRRVGAAGAVALSSVEQKLADAAAGFLTIDVMTVLMMGWAKHRALMGAARRTAQAPPGDLQEPVVLASHDIVLTQRPTVDVMVNGQKALTLAFELTMTISLTPMEALVRQGRLVALGGGNCTVKTAFSLAGTELGASELPLDLRVVLPLGRGIPLFVPQPRQPMPR